MRVRKKLALCVSVMGLWNGIEDNTLKALKKYWISAVWASYCQTECFLISFSVCFLSVCPHISIPLRNVQGERAGVWKEIRHFLCQYAYTHRFTGFTHHHLLSALSLYLSIFLSISLPLPLFSPKIQSCICKWWRVARQFYTRRSKIY